MIKKILTLDNVPVINRKIGKIDTIEKLKASTIYSLGDVVEVLGYYTAGDGAHHKRKIESADDGSGVQLANGLWANIVHNGEVNVSWFGARPSMKVVYDTSDVLQKILNIKSVKRIMFSHGWWGFSATTIERSDIQITGEKLAQYCQISKNQKVIETFGTVFFPISEQDFIISYGKENDFDYSYRNYLIESITFHTNCWTTDGEGLIKGLTGAKIGLRVYTGFKGRLQHLTFTGNNPNMENGLWFNGYETRIDDIFFRNCGVIGSPNFKYLMSLSQVIVNGGTYSSPSGMTVSNISAEGGAFKIIKAQGVDYTIENVCTELGFYSNNIDENCSIVSSTDENIEAATHHGIIAIDQDTYGIVIKNVTAQGLGVCYNQNGTNNVVDAIVCDETKWGAYGVATVSGVVTQGNKSSIIYPYYCRGTSNKTALGNFAGKRKIVVSDISLGGSNIGKREIDNVEIEYIGVAERSQGKNVPVRSIYSDLFQELNYKNNCIPHNNFFRKNTYVMSRIIANDGFPSELENAIAIYKFYEKKYVGEIEIEVEFERLANDATFTLVFDFVGGTSKSVEVKYTTVVSAGVLRAYSNIEKNVVEKLTIFSNHNVYLQKIKISPVKNIRTDSLLAREMEYAGGRHPETISYADFFKVDEDNRSYDVRITRATALESPTNTECVVTTFRTGVINNAYEGLQMAYSLHNTDRIYIRNGSGRAWRKIATESIATSLDTPYYTLKMQQEGVYEDFVAYMDSKLEYDKEQRYLEEQRQSAFESREDQEQTYEEWLATQPVLIPDNEPQPSEKLLEFKNKYIV